MPGKAIGGPSTDPILRRIVSRLFSEAAFPACPLVVTAVTALMIAAVRLWKKLLLGVGALALAALGAVTYMIGGPRNLIGMLRYDQRQEGTLKVGDRAPDVALVALDGKTPVKLSERDGRQADRPDLRQLHLTPLPPLGRARGGDAQEVRRSGRAS